MSMNRLSTAKRVAIVRALVEGCSIASTVRMTGVSKPTVLRFLLEIGSVCLAFEDEQINNLECDLIECDEIWGFCHAKDRNLPTELRGVSGFGSVWTWVAMCAKSKLICSWIMGDRDTEHANALMRDLADRLNTKPQISTDALGCYPGAIARAFGTKGADYGIQIKEYGRDDTEGRYSPAKCISCSRETVFGAPDESKISTSYAERANLTIRMSQRRWTRLTNAHSKSFTHMEAAFALHTWHYNWSRKHATLKKTPAMAAGLADAAWTVEALVGLLETKESAEVAGGSLKRGKYSPRVK